MTPFDSDILLHMIYHKRFPTVRGGGINVPVVCPPYLRREFGIYGSPGIRLKIIVDNYHFPFKIVHQRGISKGQLTFPHDMDWESFVGPEYNASNVGGYAFLPREFEVPRELEQIQYNICWWPDVLIPYAHCYDEHYTPLITEERKDNE